MNSFHWVFPPLGFVPKKEGLLFEEKALSRKKKTLIFREKDLSGKKKA